ncbi:MAG TPA: Rne/Rng family ribonuclease [Thermoanaerobaculia bacterium]|nr:Rne/Rng family ribonuclease [Thermoanaerobaculia bacterium]
MTRRMLINARNPAELRVALLSDGALDDFKVDVAERGMTRGNIYFGIIVNIQPSLNAAFIDYGADRHGFLPIQDVVPDAYYHPVASGGRARIEDVLEKGQPIVVQVTREPEGSKGSALTTNLSLAGRYLVLMPFERTRAVSRKVTSEEQRQELKRMVESLEVPEGCGVIVRTNALGQNKTALQRDLTALLRLWKRIGSEARVSKKNKLLYSDQDIVLQALRDYLDAAVEEVVVDEPEAYRRAEEYMRAFMPRSKTKLIHYTDRLPLFAGHHVEAHIDRIYERVVPLPSGGSIVLDTTEALTAIDVNSGRSTRASSQEETALHTNLEAAREVARQLRLRDFGGLVVVDFIDMRNLRSQKKVEKELREAMKNDRARVTIGRISPNGLLEINRQRLHQAIQLRTHESCPTCSGTGRVRSPELQALHVMRTIEGRAAGGFLKAVQASLHPEMANYIQNTRRQQLLDLERELDVKIEILAVSKLSRSEQDFSWVARDRAEIQRLEKEVAESRRVALEMAQAASIGDADAPDAPVDGVDDFERDDEENGVEAGSDAAPGSEAEREGRRRPRRRRRRRSGSRAAGNGNADQTADSASASPTGETAEVRSAPPKPARRAPAKKVEQAAESDSGNDGASVAEGDEEAGNGARRRRRRPRRRRRGAGSANGAAPGEDSAPANDASATPPTGSEGSEPRGPATPEV